jgi:hypothetical protein
LAIQCSRTAVQLVGKELLKDWAFVKSAVIVQSLVLPHADPVCRKALNLFVQPWKQI